ncbi:hypothetical protein KMW28_02180 [Flammeovirga yaeyamensis]|uniref:Uncharacterized protein n=1 Tax=Flammeovirga yaeyamensis TaxID=367791 RepID=A0AAX1N4E7_9BACT|nr:hypothetical protein [Flammeovirga yaeyamensis]MBB3701463.1 hypothetical protein [Flammeovirga yaeyamensis]NMF38505.1 hypothetical protein [Flammeovirga yaeyamensis]QWG02414.1 hypothetical protein KMW28_02180 [Flammeovirga yaeyamensis]
MKLNIDNLELKASISWFKEDWVMYLLKLVPTYFVILVFFTGLIPNLLLDENPKWGYYVLLATVITNVSITIVSLIVIGSTKIECDGVTLIVKHPRGKEISIPTNTIAQLYLDYHKTKSLNSNTPQVNLVLRTKDDNDIPLLEDRTISAYSGRKLESAIEDFLGIDDYSIDGEYQLHGLQKKSIEQVKSFDETVAIGDVIDINEESHILEKKYQFEWDNQRVDHLLWANNGKEKKVFQRKHEKYYLEKSINPTKFFLNAFFKDKVIWEDLKYDFTYQNNYYTIVEDLKGQFFPDHTVENLVSIQQKTYKSTYEWITIRQFSENNFEVSKVEIA